MRIDLWLSKYAKRNPYKLFIQEKNNKFSYKEFNLLVDKLARNLDFNKSSKIALAMRPGISYVQALLGVYRSENIAVPLNIESKISEWGKICMKYEIDKIIVDVKLFNKNIDFFKNFKTIIIINSNYNIKTIENSQSFYNKNKINKRTLPKNLRLILHTSGTTSSSKGVMLTDTNLCSNAKAIVKILKISSKDKACLVLSPIYAFGNSIINSHLCTGSSINIGSQKFSEKIFKIIEEEVTIFYGVPTTFRILLKYKNRFKKAFSKVRQIGTAGGPMEKKILKQIHDLCRSIQICLMYGQTEATARLAYVPPQKIFEGVDTIGIPIPNVILDVKNTNGQSVSYGIIGELVARGPNIMAGYFNDLQLTNKTIKNGWLYTGDLAIKQPNGFFRLIGRKDDMIKVGENKIMPKEIEETIEEIKNISKAFVFPLPNKILGNVVGAAILPKKNAIIKKKTILLHCKQKLPRFKIPKTILFINKFPLTKNGKVSRKKLQEDILDGK